MEVVDSTSSPRDHVADSNPDLARKKQRLADRSSSSTEESIVVEACEPEEVGDDPSAAITIDDDLALMEPYQDGFSLWSQAIESPESQLLAAQSMLEQHGFLEWKILAPLSNWVSKHIETTEDDNANWRFHYLEDESLFFTQLAKLCVTIMGLEQPFDVAAEKLHFRTQRDFERLIVGLGHLSVRIIQLLPEILKNNMARRDSVHPSARRTATGLLRYITLASQVCSPNTDAVAHFTIRNGIDMPSVCMRICETVCADDVLRPLTAVVRLLSSAPRDTKDSWVVLYDTFAILKMAIQMSQAKVLEVSTDLVFDLLEVLNTSIMPIIREKHPRALPDRFHTEMLDFGAVALRTHTALNDRELAFRLYEHAVKSETDTLLSHVSGDVDGSDALWETSGDSIDDLADLLSLSWTLQHSYSLLCSSVMDVKNVGLGRFCHYLVDLYNVKHLMPQIHHAARFLKQNEVAKYIFGAESHASLVLGSREIVGFLAYTETYTEKETDIIWQACTTSVEADFVKAAFGILQYILEPLTVKQAEYILKKYLDTPPRELGPDAINYLPKLLCGLDVKTLSKPESRMSVALVNVEIFRRALREKAGSNVLENIVLTEIGRMCGPEFDPAIRLSICQRCTPDVANHEEDATATIHILILFLSNSIPVLEKAKVAAMCPMFTALDELCAFVNKHKDGARINKAITGVLARLDYIIRLVSLNNSFLDKDQRERLFAHVFGAAALSNAARDAAWSKLNDMSLSVQKGSVNELVRECLDDLIPQLPIDVITPKLVAFIGNKLSTKCKEGQFTTNPESLLNLPCWKALLRVGRCSPDNEVVSMVVQVCDDIFFTDCGILYGPPDCVDRCHTEFARRNIQTLCDDFGTMVSSGSTTASWELLQGLNLLDHMLYQSIRLAQARNSTGIPENFRLDGDKECREDLLEFKVTIHDFNRGTFTSSVRAAGSNTLLDLFHEVKQATGAPRLRGFVRGIEISDSGRADTPREGNAFWQGDTLKNAGICSDDVVFINTRYNFHLGSYRERIPNAPMAQQIMMQYTSLEAFLDGPDELAMKAYGILRKLPPQAQILERIASAGATPADVFPADKKWKSMLSVHALWEHLLESTRRGVADGAFIAKAIQLLTAALLYESRPFDLELVSNLSRALLTFLGESTHPESPHSESSYLELPRSGRSDQVSPYQEDISEEHSHLKPAPTRLALQRSSTQSLPAEMFEAPNHFVHCVIELLFRICDQAQPGLSSHGLTVDHRPVLIGAMYEVLIESFSLNPALWAAFARNERMSVLHEKLLLKTTPEIAYRVFTSIKKFLNSSLFPRGIARAYWDAIIRSLPQALRLAPMSELYFDLAAEIFVRDAREPGAPEENYMQIRSVVDLLLQELWAYEHSEDETLCWPDKAIAGLLKLLVISIVELRTHKRPLNLPDLATKVFSLLLFPDQGSGRPAKPLIHRETRDLAYDLFDVTVDFDDHALELLRVSSAAIGSVSRNKLERFTQDWIRSPNDCAGLANLGMTCYMNSLLQQLFANIPFRNFLLNLPVQDRASNVLLFELQSVFARMQESLAPYVDPEELAQALDVQFNNQEDVHGFYAMLLARLEDCMPDAESKAKLTQFFFGESVTQVRGDCGHVSSRTEKFSDLSITVKNKASLHEGLKEFVQGEPMEGANKYKCMTCDAESGGKLVKALRRTCLEQIPPTLTFCLKRFTYDLGFDGENKVNDRFEFPGEIDMSKYSRRYLEDPEHAPDPDIFELVGVIVHHGSLAFGHYWSHVRLPNASYPFWHQWSTLEDNRYCLRGSGLQEIQEQCFGGLRYTNGLERSDNAYVLVYQRRSYVSESHDMTMRNQRRFNPNEFSPPRLPIPSSLLGPIQQDNREHQQTQFLFDDRFAALSRNFMVACTRLLDFSSPGNPEATEESLTDDDRVQREQMILETGRFIVDYLLEVLVRDPYVGPRIFLFVKCFIKLVATSPDVAVIVLRHFIKREADGIKPIVTSNNEKCRTSLNEILIRCLQAVKEHNSAQYSDLVVPLIHAHVSLLAPWPSPDGMFDNWGDYFRLPAAIASFGVKETMLILDCGYLTWILDAINAKFDEGTRENHRSLSSWLIEKKPDFTPAYALLHDLLSQHVDLTSLLDSYHTVEVDRHDSTARGISLTSAEYQKLVMRKTTRKKQLWPLCYVALRECEIEGPPEEYPPALVIGLMVSNQEHSLFRLVEEEMIIRYEQEQDFLEPMLYVTLQICANREDMDVQHLLKVLAANLLEWDGCEDRVVEFFQHAASHSPVSVITTIPIWALKCLQAKSRIVRHNAGALLAALLFDSPPLTENEHGVTKNFARVQCARTILGLAINTLQEAYQTERNKSRFLTMCDVVTSGMRYLEVLLAQLQDPECVKYCGKLHQEFVIQGYEAEALLVQLRDFTGVLNEWTVKPALPTRFVSAKYAAEVPESEDDDSSSEGEDDADEEVEMIPV